MKVFGVGLSKTGTTSLTTALNTLGIPTLHYPPAAPMIDGNYRPEWLNQYQGATDITVAFWYKHFDRAWENSKFILTIRDTESWAKSIKSWVREINKKNPQSSLMRWLVFGDVRYTDEYILRYECHNQEVVEYFAGQPGKLLVMNIVAGDGWEKLCEFLNKPVPTVPFPSIKPS